MMVQTWDVPFTPRDRWILMQLAMSPEAGNITSGPDGKAFRRALRAFGLMPIREALGRGNRVADKMAHDTTPALFKITAENVDAAIRWTTTPHHPSIEMDAGDAFDRLEQLKAAPNDWTTPANVPTYDPALEDWRPEPDQDEVNEATALDLVTLIVNSPSRPADPEQNPIACWSAEDWRRARQLVEPRTFDNPKRTT